MTQRSIEMVIGRLSTDEEFRWRFLSDPHQTLMELLEWGAELTEVEIEALMTIDSTLWERIAQQIDERLQKASLKP